MSERPFTDREMQVLRGMIDEYMYRRERRRQLGRHLSVGERTIVAIAAFIALVIPVVNLIVNLFHPHQ